MTSIQLKNLLEKELAHENWVFTYDREKDSVRVEDKESKKGVTISLPGLIAKYEQNGQNAIMEYVYYVKETLSSMKRQVTLNGQERNIYPVIRSTSFPTKTSDDIPLVYDDHTAETRIYYAIDMGKSYRLIDQKLAERENLQLDSMKEMALFNVRSLPTAVKEDTVAGNSFYFINSNDGYDASRILNDSFLNSMKKNIVGTMTISVPHQDVLIIGDIRNEKGYDILAELTMSFFASGKIPITALSFLYEEGKLEPIFILGKNNKE
ncbi:DUF1444 domain-containing protein [Sutcliffiella cohnii]|uniref:UPF0354 protein BC6307_17145 n=1 Tax=Sutcliffiella cohnii TaxID=33932 RepID=A0A223KYH3_9BACI|nr:DUF1444 domain-containing protein [Sutcliffiella cohnii]AST94398.1 DUF1444 domain-containing protein [Sutcliffiella cohnii]MED4016154.1 DUF1444 domain-containing protein [Sutcliffiella cohnii]